MKGDNGSGSAGVSVTLASAPLPTDSPILANSALRMSSNDLLFLLANSFNSVSYATVAEALSSLL